jgi:hypothetical protein
VPWYAALISLLIIIFMFTKLKNISTDERS